VAIDYLHDFHAEVCNRVYSSDYDRSGKHTNGASVQDIRQGKKDDKNKIPLTTRESIELFQNAVETSRHEHPKTTNGEAPGDILRPKLTVDLRHKQLNQIPKEVIAILRKDVERYDFSRFAFLPRQIDPRTTLIMRPIESNLPTTQYPISHMSSHNVPR